MAQNFGGTNWKQVTTKVCECGKPRMKGRKKCLLCLTKQARIQAQATRREQKKRLQIRKAKKKEKKNNSISHLTKEADKLFSLAVRLRDKKCLRTGSVENLQCSHIWGRANKSVRWDLDNALTLSAGQHLYWWHKEPAEAIEWAKVILGEDAWARLKDKRNACFKLTPEFLKEKISFLKNYINKLST